MRVIPVRALNAVICPGAVLSQASQEVEEMRAGSGHAPLKHAPWQAVMQLRRIRFDTWIGMAISNAIAFFIMLTAAATLHAHHITVQTSADAALALKPIAGRFCLPAFYDRHYRHRLPRVAGPGWIGSVCGSGGLPVAQQSGTGPDACASSMLLLPSPR